MLHINRTIDLSQVDAIGFDLDHTLVIYDDQAVNEIAASETRQFLVEDLGYHHSLLSLPYVHRDMQRGLQIDTVSGHVTKCDAQLFVLRATRGKHWIDDAGISVLAQIKSPSHRFHPLHSPFDIPTGILFNDIVGSERSPADHRKTCSDVRCMLDRSHTTGELKRTILGNVSRFARIEAEAIEVVKHIKDLGKKVFILTNSEQDYAIALLDELLPDWPELFDFVGTNAGKPSFFIASHSAAVQKTGEMTIMDCGTLELVESHLGTKGSRIVYVGDNAEIDVRSASGAGWLAIMVLPELDAPETIWGSPFRENESPTWYRNMIVAASDGIVATISDLSALAQRSRITSVTHPLPKSWAI